MAEAQASDAKGKEGHGTAGVRDKGGRRSAATRLCWERSSDSSAAAPWKTGWWWNSDALARRWYGLMVAASSRH